MGLCILLKAYSSWRVGSLIIDLNVQVCDLWLIKDLLHTNKAIIITWGCRGC